jgi:hypothetical protein
MKRGLIAWDQAELPRAAFEARLAGVQRVLVDRDLPALVVHTDVAKSNQGRFFSNVILYWNRALLVIPREGAPILLCGLSPRVYPWIRSVTILEEIRPAPNLAQALLQLCAERNWNRVGALDFPQFPYDLYEQLCATAIDLPSAEILHRPDMWELAMYKTAIGMARRILEDALPDAPGLTDFQFTGHLEREFRRAGAEDVVILLTNGQTPPLPANGARLEAASSVAVALEYRGHWVKLARSSESARQRFGEAVRGNPEIATTVEHLSGQSLFALHVESNENGRRFFHGDTCLKTENGAELL